MAVLALGLINNNGMCHFQAEMESKLPASTISLLLHEINFPSQAATSALVPGKGHGAQSQLTCREPDRESEINLPLLLLKCWLYLLLQHNSSLNRYTLSTLKYHPLALLGHTQIHCTESTVVKLRNSAPHHQLYYTPSPALKRPTFIRGYCFK